MISLVVPVFNMEQYLLRCMTRLLNQNGDYEIILVNDGSTDGSGDLCDRYATEYPNLVRVIHKENGGLSSARNAGIDVAQGEFVIFPDPDDWVENNFVSHLMELQKKYNPDLLCIGHYIDSDIGPVSVNKGVGLQQMDSAQAQKALLVSPCINGFAWNKLYHMEIIRFNRIRFLDNVGTTEDLDFTFRYLKYCHQVIFSPEDRLYHYYQHRGAATHSSFSCRKLESIRTYEKIIMYSKDQELIRVAEEEICNTAINLIWSYKNSHLQDDEVWMQLRWYLRKYLKQYCTSKRYGFSRKIQAVLAYCMPKLYVKLKNQVNQEI